MPFKAIFWGKYANVLIQDILFIMLTNSGMLLYFPLSVIPEGKVLMTFFPQKKYLIFRVGRAAALMSTL